MIDIDNQVDFTYNVKQIERIALTLTQKDIELIITDNNHMQTINLTHRGIDKPTDVLSFPYESMPHSPLGSIVISSDFVIQKAQEFGHSSDDEFALLFIHGLLHLLGMDHEIDNGEMRQKEQALIEHFNLPKSLIVRSKGA